jgi:GT2 family glycosyltransferase
MPATSPSATIVIPTYGRLCDLRTVVEAVHDQDPSHGAEVELVVVDDGSDDGTWEWLQGQQKAGRLTALRQSNSGPARARNRGVAAARGEVILFLGDDTVPQDGWLLAHLEEHRLSAETDLLAVLGYTSFPPESDAPFLRFINEYGAQFGYQLIDEPLDVPFNFFYTSNISIPRRLLVELGGFREDFPAAAWEDIEFSYRATSKGLRLRYQPRARVLHHHRIQARTFCRRQRTSGRSAAIFARLHPELGEFLGVGRLTSLPSIPALYLSMLRVIVELGERFPLSVPHGAYQRFVDISYLRGLAEGLQELSAEVQHEDTARPPVDRGAGGDGGG